MTDREGYFLIDHRASPGMPKELVRQNAYDPSQLAEGKIFEGKVKVCCGCRRPVVLNPLRQRERHHCYQCNHFICDVCYGLMKAGHTHVPFEKLADTVLNAAAKGMTLGSPSKLILP